MSDSSSSSLISTPAKIDVVPENSSDEAKELTGSDASTPDPEAPKKSDPFDTGLPEEDDDELAWHKATLIAEEDIRERVTIPAEFPARHLWSPSSSPSDLSCPALGANPSSPIIIPPVVLAQAHAALFDALSSSSQLSSDPPRPASTTEKKRRSEPIVTLFCPFDHTAGVIDALVCKIATSEGADVLVLDSLMFAQGKDTSLGPGQ
jgi:hypothetical protein